MNKLVSTIIILMLALMSFLAIGWYMQYRKYKDLLETTSSQIVVDDEQPGKGQPSFLLVDKGSMTLSVIDGEGRSLMRTGIACGRNYGNKRGEGDNRTPEGVFHVQQIQDASSWKHDFNDGNGEIEGAYGPWFIRLLTPGHKGIGIHGTHNPASIGTRATEGCMRLNNDELERLQPMVRIGMPVVIVPSVADDKANEAE